MLENTEIYYLYSGFILMYNKQITLRETHLVNVGQISYGSDVHGITTSHTLKGLHLSSVETSINMDFITINRVKNNVIY